MIIASFKKSVLILKTPRKPNYIERRRQTILGDVVTQYDKKVFDRLMAIQHNEILRQARETYKTTTFNSEHPHLAKIRRTIMSILKFWRTK